MVIAVSVIVLLIVLLVPILLIRFRKRWAGAFNLAVTNRITSLFAGRLPGFGILTHVGRNSGKVYRTPVNVFRGSNGFIIALTYSSQIGVGEERPCGGRLRTKDSREEISAFRPQCRA